MSWRVFVIAWKELLQLRRDRLTAAMMFALPIVQLLLFGYAINTDVRHIKTVVVDDDRSAASRDLIRTAVSTGFYDVVGNVASYPEVVRAIRSDDARVAFIIPPKYSEDLHAGKTAKVQLVVDGSDPQVVASATNTAASLVAARAADLNVQRLSLRGLSPPNEPVHLEPSVLFNPDLRTAVYIVPGLTGVILTMTMVMITSMALARERERGTLEQLIVSPVKSTELVIGKIVPYVGIGYVQMAVILTLGRVVFGVPIIGSLPLLFLLAFVFVAANLAIGLLFSTVAQTQQQAMQMSFFFLLPNILLSGFMFPFEAMPRPAQWVSTLLPLTHFLRIVRGIVLKGSTFAELRMELVWLTGILLFLITFTSLRFRKKLV